MLIFCGNRQFDLRNIWRNVHTCTCAWQFTANLKMSDVSDNSYLCAVAAAEASVVITVDITKRRLKKRRTWVQPLLRSRSVVKTRKVFRGRLHPRGCDLCRQDHAFDYSGYITSECPSGVSHKNVCLALNCI